MLSMMSKKSTEMTTDHLRDLVHQMLCDIGQLESSQFPLCERPLTRGGNPCGVLFSVNGPREVTLTAVWDCLKNKLFVYDSTGNRCEQLSVEHLATASASAAFVRKRLPSHPEALAVSAEAFIDTLENFLISVCTNGVSK